MKKNRATAFLDYLIFFVTIAAVMTCAMLVYGVTASMFGGDKLIIALVMLVFIVFVSAVFTAIDSMRRKIMVERPVDKILEATEKIAAGDFSVRLEITHSYNAYDGYDCIMENLNKMAYELSKSEMLASDFISNVSHELKTPLAVIQNYAAALSSKNIDEQTRVKYVNTIIDASKKLTDLVVNVLKLNKLENQTLRDDYEEVRLDEMLAECIISQEEKIEEKGLELFCDIDEIKINTCPNYLEIVWNNLISNAIKFTEKGGKISVSLKDLEGKAVVKISDTGIGISKESGKRIFDKFYQADTSHSGAGNGLGLALVKKVIDILGGQISVESEIGKGTSFTVVLNKRYER